MLNNTSGPNFVNLLSPVTWRSFCPSHRSVTVLDRDICCLRCLIFVAIRLGWNPCTARALRATFRLDSPVKKPHTDPFQTPSKLGHPSYPNAPKSSTGPGGQRFLQEGIHVNLCFQLVVQPRFLISRDAASHRAFECGQAKTRQSVTSTRGATPKRGSPSPQLKGPHQSVGVCSTEDCLSFGTNRPKTQ